MAKQSVMTEDLVASGWSAIDAGRMLELLMGRSQLKKREDEVTAMKDEINTEVANLLLRHGVEKVENGFIGSLSLQVSTRNSINKETLQLELATRGVDVKTITESVAAAIKPSVSTSVVFRAVGEQK